MPEFAGKRGERYVSAKRTEERLSGRGMSGGCGVFGCSYVHFAVFAEGDAVCYRGSAYSSGDISVEMLRGARYESCCCEESEDVCGAAEACVWNKGQTMSRKQKKRGAFTSREFFYSE